MEINNTNNPGYWFVVREDQSNVILSSNNFTIQSPQISAPAAKYVVGSSDNQQFIQTHNVETAEQEDMTKSYLIEMTPLNKEEENFWDRNKIKLLLNLCLDNRFKGEANKMLWNEISILIGTTPEECDRKYRNLRRTFIRLLKKKKLGKDIKWVHYATCEEVFKDCKTMSPAILEPWEDSKVRKLLNLYIENINKFRSSECLQKDVWKEISTQLNTTYYNCYHKFKNLKRTYFNLVEKCNDTSNVKWPYLTYFERIFYNYQPGVGPWDKNKIRLLISAYSEIAHKFKNPKYQKKELWKEISRKVGESAYSCDRKFRNLKQTYIRLKIRAHSGRSITKWRYYKDFVSIFENEPYHMVNITPEIIYKPLDQDYVRQLLTFYIENKKKFRDPLVKKKNLWRMIGPKLGLSPEVCDKKFRNLKQTYIRLAEKKRDTGKGNGWPYYAYFEEIYGEPRYAKSQHKHDCNIDNATMTEIRTIVNTAHENKDKNKFDKFVKAIEDSNNIQRERNKILQSLLDRMPC